MKTKNKIILSLVGLITSLLIVTFVMINIVNIGSHNDIIDDVIIEEICEPAVSFSRDSWETIACNINKGNISAYNVGDTKEVTLDGYGTQTLRIANMSTPDICNTKGFSQSACGFVLEFTDILAKYAMNNTDTNKGGWPASDMYKFINGTDDTTYNAYIASEDTTSIVKSIYMSLPEDLRNIIIDTTVVSGHDTVDNKNFTSTDKLYLLSNAEVWAQGSFDKVTDTAKTITRQLDYYYNHGVTLDNFSKAIKQYNGKNSIWYLRSVQYKNYYIIKYDTDPSSFSLSDFSFFYGVSFNGNGTINIASESVEGVSVAFRIGLTALSETVVVDPNNEENCKTAFCADSWETISNNVKNGNTSAYKVGDTKKVTLDGYGTQTLRIANMSTPDECNKEGFSQSACGFVLEFEGIIASYYMNPSGIHNGLGYDQASNLGGWPASLMYKLVNGTDETLYSAFATNNLEVSSVKSIYMSLPEELRKVIIDTYVVSGHGELDNKNFTSTDKLYLLNGKEVYGTLLFEEKHLQKDTANDFTRQLDYYFEKTLTASEDKFDVKYYNNTGENYGWWLRSASSSDSFFSSFSIGGLTVTWADFFALQGVSPAFRIG